MANYGHKYCRQMLARRPLAGAFSTYPPHVNSSLQNSLYTSSLSLIPATGLKVTELVEVTHILACHCEGVRLEAISFPNCHPRRPLLSSPRPVVPVLSIVEASEVEGSSPLLRTQIALCRNPHGMVCIKYKNKELL